MTSSTKEEIKNKNIVVITTIIISFVAFFVLSNALWIKNIYSGTGAKVINGEEVSIMLEGKYLPIPFNNIDKYNKIAMVLTKNKEIIYIITFNSEIYAINNSKKDIWQDFNIKQTSKYVIASRTKESLEKISNLSKGSLNNNKQFVVAKSEVPNKSNLFVWVDTKITKDLNKENLENIIDTNFSDIISITAGIDDISGMNTNHNIIKGRVSFNEKKLINNKNRINYNMSNYIPNDIDFFISGYDIQSETNDIKNLIQLKFKDFEIDINKKLEEIGLSLNSLNFLLSQANQEWAFGTKNNKWIIVLKNNIDSKEYINKNINNIIEKLYKNLPFKFPTEEKAITSNGKEITTIIPNKDIIKKETKDNLTHILLQYEEQTLEISYGTKDSFIFISNSPYLIERSFDDKQTLSNKPEMKLFLDNSKRYQTQRGYISKKILKDIIPEWILCINQNNECKTKDLYFAKWSMNKEDFWTLMY